MQRIVLFFVLAGLLSSCFERGDCTGVSYNIINVGFFNFSDKKPKTIALDSIKVEGHSEIFYKARSVSSVSLPLHPESNSITYYLYFGSSYSTLKVDYRIRTFALAPDCDAIDIYSLVDATGESINEVAIKQNSVVKSDAKNIYLYF